MSIRNSECYSCQAYLIDIEFLLNSLDNAYTFDKPGPILIYALLLFLDTSKHALQLASHQKLYINNTHTAHVLSPSQTVTITSQQSGVAKICKTL